MGILKRYAVLGASRGLGLATIKAIAGQSQEISFLLASRKVHQLSAEFQSELNKTLVVKSDFTNLEQQLQLMQEIEKFQPESLLYIAGGGPYGDFSKKTWKDHEWAFQLNLLFPAKLLHSGLSKWRSNGLQQMVFVGSNIAEAQPDPSAASYSSGKHGLFGLIRSVAKENPDFDLRLFSPGYMDTDMLPRNAFVRQSGKQLPSADQAAGALAAWLKNSKSAFHKVWDFEVVP